MSFSLGEMMFLFGAFVAFFLVIFVTVDIERKKKLPNELELLLDYIVPLGVWIAMLLVMNILQKNGWL